MKIFKNMKINLKGIFKPNKTLSILDYQIHDYLKKNAVGYSKRIKSSVLMKEFNINDNKTLRKHIQNIRQDETLQKIVCSESGKNGGYWIAKNDKEVQETLDHLYNRAMEMLKTYSIIKNKANLDRQYRLKMTKYEKELIESVMR